MRVYLAAPYYMKDVMNERAAELRAAGIIVTATWLDEPHKPTTQMHELTHEEHQKYAVQDVKDVLAADILVFQGDETKTVIRAGRTVEFGMIIGANAARTKQVPIYVVGTGDENIFHHCPEVTHFLCWPAVRDLLIALAAPNCPRTDL
jgi:nucleoside 2-deoxyribosyltransferase